MKNLLYKVSFICLMVAAFVGCDPVEQEEYKGGVGDFNLHLKEPGSDFAEFYVTAPSTVEMAYVVGTEPQVLTAPVLFMTGRTMQISPEQIIRIEANLQPNTGYIMYAAVKIDDMNYSPVMEFEFETSGYEFSEMLTVVDRSFDGFKVHITVPEETKERGNVLRYTGANKAIYNVLKSNYGNEGLMLLEGVVANGNRYKNFVKNDSTVARNSMTVVELDENGNPIIDENGDMIDVHDPITPGETYVFYAGECTLGTDEEMGAITGWYYGTPNTLTWQVPLFSWEEADPDFDWSLSDRTDYTGSGWTGAFQKIEFKVKEPILMEPTVNVRIPEDEISVIDARIYFEVDEGVDRYFYMVLDNSTYYSIVDQYLGKRGAPEEEIDAAFQWFLTSYLAFQTWSVGAETENTVINAALSFADGVLVGGETYHVVCTAMADDETFVAEDGRMTGDGALQNYVHKVFSAKEKTMGPPVVEIKAVDSSDPYLAKFNIKAPNKDLAGAYYAANYSREFQLMVNMGYSYSDLAQMQNRPFSPEEIEAVNSDEGFDVFIPTLDGETIRFIVYGCNEEYTFNRIDLDVEGAGWADYVAPMAPKVTPVESPYYNALAGDWKMTAKIRINEEIDGEVLSSIIKWNSDVTISSSIQGLPDKVDENVYDLYLDTEAEEGTPEYDKAVASNIANVNSMFDEMLELSDRFAEYRVTGQNRLLCTGFIDYDSYDISRLSYRNPYDLFTATDYSSVDVSQIMNDFGPKWYFEVKEDGSIIVPFSYNTLPPMSAWSGVPFYVGGVGAGGAFYEATEAFPGFPVEVSKDYNMITIKPIVLKATDETKPSVPYYMNALGVSDAASGQLELLATVVSDIILTRKVDTRSAAEDNVLPHSVATAKVNPITVNGEKASLPKTRVCKSITKFEAKPKTVYKYDEKPHVITKEMFDESIENILKQYKVK